MGVAVGEDIVEKAVSKAEVVRSCWVGSDWWEDSWQTAVRTDRSSALA